MLKNAVNAVAFVIALVILASVGGCAEKYTVISREQDQQIISQMQNPPFYALGGSAVAYALENQVIIVQNGKRSAYALGEQARAWWWPNLACVISADGRYMLYQRSHAQPDTTPHAGIKPPVGLYELDLQTGKQKLLCEQPKAFDEAIYSPDGSKIALLRKQDSAHFVIYALEKSTSNLEQIYESKGQVIKMHQWATDKDVLITATNNGTKLLNLNIDDGKTLVLHVFPKDQFHVRPPLCQYYSAVAYAAVKGNDFVLTSLDASKRPVKAPMKDSEQLFLNGVSRSNKYLAGDYQCGKAHGILIQDTANPAKQLRIPAQWKKTNLVSSCWHPTKDVLLAVYGNENSVEVREYDAAKLLK